MKKILTHEKYNYPTFSDHVMTNKQSPRQSDRGTPAQVDTQERICKDCKVKETKEDLYEDGERNLLCTLCMVKFLDRREKKK